MMETVREVTEVTQEVYTCGCAGEEKVSEAELWEGLDRIIAEHVGEPGGLIRALAESPGPLRLSSLQKCRSGWPRAWASR